MICIANKNNTHNSIKCRELRAAGSCPAGRKLRFIVRRNKSNLKRFEGLK